MILIHKSKNAAVSSITAVRELDINLIAFVFSAWCDIIVYKYDLKSPWMDFAAALSASGWGHFDQNFTILLLAIFQLYTRSWEAREREWMVL